MLAFPIFVEEEGLMAYTYKWALIPNVGENIFSVGTEGTILTGEESDTTSLLKNPDGRLHFSVYFSQDSAISERQ